MPDIMFSNVVLPEPEGPKTTTNSPLPISRLMFVNILNATDLL
jgi:hypothetical protein